MSARPPGIPRVAAVAVALVVAGLIVVFARERRRLAADRLFEASREIYEAMADDPVLGTVLLPGWRGRQVSADFDVEVVINEHGMRGPALAADKPADAYRILVVGDSFSFGFGVEERQAWPWRMAAALQAGLDRGADGTGGGLRVEVACLAVPGWSPDHGLLALRHGGFDVQPDLVLLQLASNDLEELAWDDLEIGAGGLPVAVVKRPILTPEDRTRLQAEIAARFGLRLGPDDLVRALEPEVRDFALAWIGGRERARREAAGPPPDGPIATLDTAGVRAGLLSGVDFQARYLRHLVDAIERACAGRGAPLRLVLAHAHVDVAAPEDAALRAVCAERDGRCLDTAAVVPPGAADALCFPGDVHWNADGHAAVGEAVAAWLARDETLGLAARR